MIGLFLAFAVLIVLVGIVALLTSARASAQRLQLRRFELLQKALEHPQLDAATRSEILRVLAGEQRSAPLSARLGALAPLGRTAWFGIGWLLFVFGVGAAVLRWLEVFSVPTLSDSIPMALVGFGMLTLPLAIGELQARAARAPSVGR
ncbi:MAG: hypothetical protein JNL08_05600 [Planctomycetes bacterium]|nr:hypothetical protein [Planctomycetota bacterium]